MEVYHKNVSTNDTFAYGRIPTIELIRRELCGHGVGALLETSVRQLARAIGRSAGQISIHLDRLEADGWIRRLSESVGTVVEVLRTDHPHDRSFTASESDHVDDRVEASDHPTVVPNPLPTPAAAVAKSDHADDPPHTPLYGTRSLDQEEESVASASPLYVRLMGEPTMNRALAIKITSNPPGTLADFEADVKIAQAFAQKPFYFTVARWAQQQRVVAPQEAPDDRPSRPAPAAAGAGRRSAPSAAQRLPRPSDRRPKPYVTGATDRSLARALAGD